MQHSTFNITKINVKPQKSRFAKIDAKIKSGTANAKNEYEKPLKLPQAIWLATTMQALCPYT